MSSYVMDARNSARTSGSGAAHDPSGGYKRTEAGVIPDQWDASTVGVEFTVQLGKMLDSAKNSGDPKPYLGNRAVQWGRIDLEALSTVRMTPSDLQRYRLREGDLLVCEGGEVGRAAIWDGAVPECYYQKALHRLRSTRGYDPYLMLAFLQLWTTSGYFANYVTQTSIAHLPKDKFERVPLPCPPAREQRAIAEALSDVDGLLSSLDTLIAKKRAIKQAAMQQLLTGKTRLAGFSGEWEPKLLGDVAVFLKGRGLSKADLKDDGRVPCVHYGELFTVYGERINDVVSRTDGEGPLLCSVANDVLMPTSDVTPNGLATASCVARSGIALGGDILVIRSPSKMLCGEFLAYAIKVHRSQVMQLVTGTTVFHLYGRDMSNFQFLAPSVPEQLAIAAVLSDMDAEITALEARREKTRAIKQGMMQQLLTGRIRLVKPEPAPTAA